MSVSDVTITPVMPPGFGITVGRTGDQAKLVLDGGWAETARPRRTSLTEWQGWPLATLSIPFILNQFQGEGSIESAISYLEGFMRDLRGGSQPPVLSVDGPVPGTWLRWSMKSIDYTDEIRRPFDGARSRVTGVLNLIEYNEVELLVSTVPTPAAAAVERATASPAATAPSGGAKPAATGRTYTVRSGDTLSRIAQQQLGNAGRWQEIANLNGIRDPRSIRVGQVIRLP